MVNLIGKTPPAKNPIATPHIYMRRMLLPILSTASVTASLLFLWATRVPGIEECPALLLSIILWMIVLPGWSYAIMTRHLYAGRNLCYKSLVPFILVASLALGWVGLPKHIAFKASRNSLVVLAEQLLQEPATRTRTINRWVGAYYITEYEHVDEAIIFHIKGASTFSFKLSLGYFTDTSPNDVHGDWLEYEHYHGRWYVMKYYAL